MFNFSSKIFDEKINEIIDAYKQADNFETLAKMYVMNLISMRFAYRNILGGRSPYMLSISQEIGPNLVKILYLQRMISVKKKMVKLNLISLTLLKLIQPFV